MRAIESDKGRTQGFEVCMDFKICLARCSTARLLSALLSVDLRERETVALSRTEDRNSNPTPQFLGTIELGAQRSCNHGVAADKC